MQFNIKNYILENLLNLHSILPNSVFCIVQSIYRVSFSSEDIEISQKIRIVQKNIHNKNFLFLRGKSDPEKNVPHTPKVEKGITIKF